MPESNPVLAELTAAITPIVSVGVGSAIWLVCSKLNKDPQKLQRADLPQIRVALLEHYSMFWSAKAVDLKAALDQVR